MINSIFLFFISYILTLSGFLLGKATKEEHKEIKLHTNSFSVILIGISYFYLLYLSLKEFELIIFLIISGLIYILSFKEKLIEPFHHMILFGISYKILELNSQLELFLIPMTAIFVYHSFEKWEFKNEIYKIILLLIAFFFFSVVL